MTEDYELLDSGDGRKLERFGKYVLARPCSQAMWRPCKSSAEWERADASFDREDGNRWHGRSNLPKEWQVETAGIRFKLGGTDFGHLGIFPEQRAQWVWIRQTIRSAIEQSEQSNNRTILFLVRAASTVALSLTEESRNEHDSCIGDLFPYFSCEVEFAQDRIRRDWPACADRTYGTEELKRMIAAYQGRASAFLR